MSLIIQLSKNIQFIGVSVETESERTIRAQAAPVHGLADTLKERNYLSIQNYFESEIMQICN